MSGILANTYFWQAIATIALIWVLYHYKVFSRIGTALDKRGARIASELDEARRLRGDAELLLREYEVKRANAEKEAAAIVAAAREEAERITREAEARMTDFVARRTATAEAKIAQAEAQAMAEVRDAAIAAAVAASERVLRAEVQGPLGERLLKDGLGEIRGRLVA